MGFWQSIGSGLNKIGKGAWNLAGQYGGAIGGAIGGWFGGQQGSQTGGQIGGGVQQLVNPQSGLPPGSQQQPQPQYARAGMCFITTECYSEYCKPVPQKFYNFRDRLPSFLVKSYYKISPKLIPIIRATHSHRIIRKILNTIVRG